MGNIECAINFNIENEYKKPPDILIAATTSPRRIAALKHFFPNIPVLSFPGGEESDSLPVEDIAVQKIRTVQEGVDKGEISLGNHPPQCKLKKNIVYIGGDIMTTVPRLQSNKPTIFERQGKMPFSNLSPVLETFIEMSRIAQKNHHPRYHVESGTAVNTGGKIIKTRKNVQIELDRKKVQFFGTPEGYELYLRTFRSFYNEKVYTKSHPRPVTPWDISAGMSLPVLERLKAVHAIDDIHHADERYPQAYKNALYTVAVGFDEELLQKIAPQASERLNSWEWLRNIYTISFLSDA